MQCPYCYPRQEVKDGYFVCNSEHYCIEDAEHNLVFVIREHDYTDDSENEVIPMKYCPCRWFDDTTGVG